MTDLRPSELRKARETSKPVGQRKARARKRDPGLRELQQPQGDAGNSLDGQHSVRV